MWMIDVNISISDLFSTSNVLSFGSQSLGDFILDEVRIWNIRLSVYQLLQISFTELDVESYPGLTAYWTFSEGWGFVSIDHIHSCVIHLPQANAIWVLSDVLLDRPLKKRKQPSELLVDSGAVRAQCENVLQEKHLYDSCKSFGSAVIDYFVESCIIDIQLGSTASYIRHSVAILGYYCKVLLNPETSPLERLCDDRDSELYDLLCIDHCDFGEYMSNTSKCECQDGYWGYECSSLCPGGAQNPCYQHGVCDKTTGVCHCQPTYSKTSDCERCTKPWRGDDCDIYPLPTHVNGSTGSANISITAVASVFGQGHVVTFNGQTYSILQTGDYHLINSDILQVQAHVIPCQSATAACVLAVAVRYATDIFILRSGYSRHANDAIIWVNGNHIGKHSTTNTVLNFRLVRIANLKYQLSIIDQSFVIDIYVVQGYLSLTFRTDGVMCEQWNSLLAACTNMSLPFLLLGSTDLHDYRVDSEISLFISMYEQSIVKDTADSTGAGYGVFLNNSVLQALPAASIFQSQGDTTLQFFVRPYTTEGVILSYSHQSVFSVYMSNKILFLQVNAQQISTGIELHLHSWSEIVVTFSMTIDHHIDIATFVVHEAGSMSNFTMTVTEDINLLLSNQGVLTFGAWIPPFNSHILHPCQVCHFVGDIDEVRIWHRKLHTDELQHVRSVDNLLIREHLVLAWTFVEGEGLFSRDVVGGVDLIFVERSTAVARVNLRGTWIVSTAPILLERITSAYSFKTKHQLDKAEQHCQNVIYSNANSNLNRDHPILVTFHYLSCLHDVAISINLEASLPAVLSLADIFQSMLDLTTWPAQSLCTSYSWAVFPVWIGPQCDVGCYFPDTSSEISSSSESCSCRHGFHGASCSNICPGGYDDVCSGNGACNRGTGDCKCVLNHAGASCDDCAQSWMGEDCDAIYQNQSDVHFPTCSISAGMSLMMFDGYSFFTVVTGVLVLYDNPETNSTVHAMQVPCDVYDSCTVAVALHINDNVTLIIDVREFNLVKLNDEPISIVNDTYIHDDYRVVHTDRLNYMILSHYGFEMRISKMSSHLSISLSQSPEFCNLTYGICGPCSYSAAGNQSENVCPDGDHVCNIQTMGMFAYETNRTLSKVMREQFLSSYVLEMNEYSTLLYALYPETHLSHPSAGYAVKVIQGGTILSEPILSTVFSQHLDTSIQITINIQGTESCVLFSYAKNDVFGVLIINSSIVIECELRLIVTSLTVVIGEWSQITVTYHRDSNKLTLYYICESRTLQFESYIFTSNVFPEGGILSIGRKEMFTSDNTTGTLDINEMLHGEINAIHLWTCTLLPSQITMLWRVYLTNTEPNLVALWKLNEGHGAVVIDIIHQTVLRLHGNVTWIPSAFPVALVRSMDVVQQIVSINTQLRIRAEQHCNALIFRGDIAVACSNSLSASAHFYYSMCIYSVLRTGNLDASIEAVLSFSFYCQSELMLDTWPAKTLCNRFPSSDSFPTYTGLSCDHGCQFGAERSPVFYNDSMIRNTSECICLDGYWGDNCDHICPGGHLTPCNNHGACIGETGMCICEETWSGDDQCGTCTAGWGGDDCSTLMATLPPDHPIICSASTGGININFDGIAFYNRLTGIFKLFKTEPLEITIRQEVNYKKQLAIERVNVYLGSVNISLEVGVKNQGSLTLNGTKVNMKVGWKSVKYYPFQSNCSVALLRRSKKEYQVISDELGLTLTMIVNKRGINVLFEISNNLCCMIIEGGLCGHCRNCTRATMELPCGMDLIDHTLFDEHTIGPGDNQTTIDQIIRETRVGAEQPGGGQQTFGNSMCFDDCSMTANKVKAFFGRYTSIEFFIKTRNNAEFYGTILSYAKQQTFAILYLDRAVKLVYQCKIYDTKLVLEDDEWNQVSIVYDRGRNAVDSYVMYSDGHQESTKDMYMQPNPLTNNGDLVLGKWQPSKKWCPDYLQYSFRGCIDDLRIWTNFLDPQAVRSHWNKHYSPDSDGLQALWTFDEMEGDHIDDLVNGIRLYNPPSPFRAAIMSPYTASIPVYSDEQNINQEIPTQKKTRGRGRGRGRHKRSVEVLKTDLTPDDISEYCDNIFVHSAMAKRCDSAHSSLRESHLAECNNELQELQTFDRVSEVVISYAHYCQMMLRLEKWPAHDLCNNFGSDVKFPRLIGEFCDIVCFFGHREPDNPDICICSHGYWNVSCNSECPGGIISPCSGFGSCDSVRGDCNCPLNRRGTNDCSYCSPGWIGPKCTVMVHNVTHLTSNTHIGKVLTHGHLYTLHGLAYKHTGLGEVDIFTLPTFLAITGKFVQCFQNFTCLSVIGMNIWLNNDKYTNITLASGSLASKLPLVAVDGSHKSLDDKVQLGSIVIERVSMREVSLTVWDQIVVSVTVKQHILEVNLQLPAELVSVSMSGMLTVTATVQVDHTYQLSSLQYDAKDLQTIQKTTNLSRNIASDMTIHDIADILTTVNGTVLTVNFEDLDLGGVWKTNHSSIQYMTLRQAEQTTAGFALKLNSVGMFTNLSSFSSDFITIEMFVKPYTSTVMSTILSFANDHDVFALVLHTTLKVQFNNGSTDTGLLLPENAWTKVTFVYDGKLGRATVYTMYLTNGQLLKEYVDLAANLFKREGTLAVGQWQTPANGIAYPLHMAFVGEVDDLRIWDIELEPSMVEVSSRMSSSLVQNLLWGAWQFDEGAGEVGHDLTHDHQFHFPILPWQQPSWILSNLQELQVSMVPVAQYFFSSSELEKISSHICSSVYNDSLMDLQCTGMDAPIKDYFYAFCMQVVSSEHNVSQGYAVILQFIHICQVTKQLPGFPGEAVCKLAPDSAKFGTKCERACQFGIVKNSSCMCVSSHYGTECASICPGGSDSPCASHGSCRPETESCACQRGWSVESNCSQCEKGKLGQDCSLFTVAPTDEDEILAYVSSTGEILTFSGLHFSLINMSSGVYTLLEIPGMVHVQGWFTNCMFGSCISAVAVATSGDEIVIYLNALNDAQPVIFLNKEQISGRYLIIAKTDLQLTVVSSHEVRMNVSGGTIHVILQFYPRSFDAMLVVNKAICHEILGILSNCSLMHSEHLSQLSHTDINHLFVDPFKNTWHETVFYKLQSNSAPTNINDENFALSFQNSSVLSERLQLFLGINGWSLNLMVKPDSNGAIISFGGTSFMAIYNNEYLEIVCEKQVITTVVRLELGVWNQIILSFEALTRNVHVFHFTNQSGLLYKVYNAGACVLQGLWAGRISLGDVYPSSTHVLSLPAQSFHGSIDQVSVWRGVLSASVVQQAINLDIPVHQFYDKLMMLWKFSEGHGFMSHGQVNGIKVNMPAHPWPTPSWILSTSHLRKVTASTNINAGIFANMTLWQNAQTICTTLFGQISHICATSDDLLTEFTSLCIEHAVVKMQKIEGIYYSLFLFAKQCDVHNMDIGVEIIDLICKQNLTKPAWVKSLCFMSRCMFGTYVEASNECHCLKGYWGKSCEYLCPGGSIAPCFTHGQCTNSGQCQCYGQWTGVACDRCLSGWSGQSCSILMSNATVIFKKNINTQVLGQGRILTADGMVFDIQQPITLNLFAHETDQLSVHGRFDLHMMNTLGTVDLKTVTLYYRDVMISIDTNSFSDEHVLVWVNKKPVTVYTFIVRESVNISRRSLQSFQIEIKNENFILDIRKENFELEIIVRHVRTDVSPLTGLLVEARESLKQISILDGRPVDKLDDVSPDTIRKMLEKFVSRHSTSIVSGGMMHNAVPHCVNITDHALMVENIQLPYNAFTLEIHLKKAHAGIILTYKQAESTFLLADTDTGLVVYIDGVRSVLGLSLEYHAWNQISLVWSTIDNLLQCFVIDSLGRIQVASLKFTDVLFSTLPGMLVFGNDLSRHAVTHVDEQRCFAGLLSEVRIWSRPLNPTVSARLWRIEVTIATPGLYLYWPLKDVQRHQTTELIRGQHMYISGLTDAIVWDECDLKLVEYKHVSLPSIVTMPVISNIADADSNTCSQIFNEKLLNICTDLDTNLLYLLMQQCIKEYVNAGTTHGTVSSLRSLCGDDETSQLICPDGSLISTGESCKHKCVYGVLANGICNCMPNFYGDTCAEACPATEHGFCNSHGSCNSGSCLCDMHWLGDVKSVWEKVHSYDVENGASKTCLSCTVNWHGVDCSLVLAENWQDHSSNVAIVRGTDLITWNGVGLRMKYSGTFMMFQVDEVVSIQAVFVPCHDAHLCRIMTSVSVNISGHVYSVSLQASDRSLLARHSIGEVMTVISHPSDTKSFIAGQNVQITWQTTTVFKIRIENVVSILIAETGNELLLGVVSSEKSVRPSGIMGLLETETDPEHLSVHAVSQTFIEKYAVNKLSMDIFHQDHVATSISGFMLVLPAQSNIKFPLSLSGGMNVFPELTISVWVKLFSASYKEDNNMVLVRLSTDQGDITLSLYGLMIKFTWNNYAHETLIPIKTSAWLYLTVTIDTVQNGNLRVITIADGELRVHKILITRQLYVVKHLHSVVLGGEGSSSQGHIAVDYLRIWSSARPVDQIIQDSQVYTQQWKQHLLAQATFDEAIKTKTILTVRNDRGGMGKTRQVQAVFEDLSDNIATWQVSDVPIRLYHEEILLRQTMAESAVDECRRLLSSEPFQKHCHSFNSYIDYFMESCVHQLTSKMPAGDMKIQSHHVLSTFAYICHHMTGTNECDFSGYLDFCVAKSDAVKALEAWVIVLIVIAIILIIIIVFVFVCFMLKSHHRKQSRVDLPTYDGVMMQAESSFMRSGITDNAGESASTSYIKHPMKYADDLLILTNDNYVEDAQPGFVNYASEEHDFETFVLDTLPTQQTSPRDGTTGVRVSDAIVLFDNVAVQEDKVDSDQILSAFPLKAWEA